MTTIRIPPPTTLEEADAMQDITVKDLIATLQTYPEDHLVFPTIVDQRDYGAELVVSEEPDIEGMSVYAMTRRRGTQLVDLADQPKTEEGK